MITRCKFKCESVLKTASGLSIVMRPVTTGSEENKTFYSYTPGGELKLEVVKKEMASEFEPGQEYYIDISTTDPF